MLLAIVAGITVTAPGPDRPRPGTTVHFASAAARSRLKSSASIETTPFFSANPADLIASISRRRVTTEMAGVVGVVAGIVVTPGIAMKLFGFHFAYSPVGANPPSVMMPRHFPPASVVVVVVPSRG